MMRKDKRCLIKGCVDYKVSYFHVILTIFNLK